MNELVSRLLTAVVALLLASFAVYLAGLWRLPVSGRPRTATYDRFGEFLELTENPDYHLSPGEDPRDDPDLVRRPGSQPADGH